MSGITYPRSPIRQRLARDQRRAKSLALVAVTLVAALLVAVGLALSTDDAPPAPNPQAAAPAIDRDRGPANVASTAQPGTRYDGGPEEGSPSIVSARPRVSQDQASAGLARQATGAQPGMRYDGGPEEGSRGTSGSSAANPGRPDGGPEEGTRGPRRRTS